MPITIGQTKVVFRIKDTKHNNKKEREDIRLPNPLLI